MAFFYSGMLAALCSVQFVLLAAATPEPHGVDVVQQRLLKSGCLPGPVKHDAYPTCVTVIGNDGTASWDPWTHNPYCVESTVNTNYCVFTNANYHGRGVSIIDVQPSDGDNATSAVSVARLLSSVPSTPEATQKKSPPYEVRDLPGKGKGLVAIRKIPRGQVFMFDYAAVIADIQFPIRVKREQGRQLLEKAAERLAGAEEVYALARSSLDPENVPAAEDVMKTNSFSVAIGGKDYMALFPKIARANHACKPRALTRFDATTLTNTLTAFDDILPGEEITVSYSDFGLSSTNRRAILRSKWGFTCTCDLCSSPPLVLAASDARRHKIIKLGNEVVELVEQGGKEDFEKAIRLYTEVIEAVKEEGLVPHMGGHYEVLGRLWAAAGDARKGGEWVKRGRLEEEGFGDGMAY